MSEQIIISIGREHGSLGHEIAVRLAKNLGYDLYDRDILNQIADSGDANVDPDKMKKYDERPRRVLGSRVVNGYSNSLEDIVSEKVFDYEKKLADSGKSFVIVGRCADYILQDYSGLVSIFIQADDAAKVKHIMSSRNKDEKDAVKEIHDVDRNRRRYHNHYAGSGWKDINNYDLILNSSRLGLEGTIDIIKEYVTLKQSHLTGSFPE